MADSHPIENWRPVVGYENAYLISDLGRVSSVDRIDSGGRKRPAQILKNSRRGGYATVGLYKNAICRIFLVHVLVLEVFVGPRPVRFVACHNNGNPSDNRLANLRWGTYRDNELDKRAHGTVYCGEKHWKAKIKESDIPEIFRLHKSGLSSRKIGPLFGVSKTPILQIVSGKTWKHARPNR